MTTTQQEATMANEYFLTDYVDLTRMEARRQVLEAELHWLEDIMAQLRVAKGVIVEQVEPNHGTLIGKHGTGVQAKAPKTEPRRLPSNKDLVFDVMPSDPAQALQASAVAKLIRKRGWRTSSKRSAGAREVVYQTLKALQKDGFVVCRHNGHSVYWHRAV